MCVRASAHNSSIPGVLVLEGEWIYLLQLTQKCKRSHSEALVCNYQSSDNIAHVRTHASECVCTRSSLAGGAVVYEHADVMLRDRHFRRRCGAYNTHIYMPQRRAVNAPTEQLMQSILSNGHYVRNAPPIEYRACKINLPCWVHLTEISVWRLVLGRSRFHYACLVHLINGVVPHSRGPPDQETSSSALPAARLRLN